MKVPIACTLNAKDAAGRVEEWRSALAASVLEVSRPDPARLVIRVGSDPARIAALVDLARREKTCCEFFGFAFQIGAGEVTLEVSVPGDATAVLDGFAALAGTGRGQRS
jgi:hypothetical protein